MIVITRLITVLALCSVLAAPFTSAAESKAINKPVFNCPDLADESQQKLAPMVQGLDGWFFRRVDFEERYNLLPSTFDYIKRVVSAFDSQGTKLVLAAVPPRIFAASEHLDEKDGRQSNYDLTGAKASYTAFLKQLRETNALIVDMTSFADKEEEKYGTKFLFQRDAHWTPLGAELTAKETARVLKQEARYDSLTKKNFETSFLRMESLDSYMTNEIVRLCNDKIPTEKVPFYQTKEIATPASSEDSQDLLFGDTGFKSSIALLGSSFSDVELFNFAGFLSEHTGLEVTNYAISAGQLYNSLISYASLPVDKRPQGGFAVWEVLAHYDFNTGERMYRQVIPAISGECSVEEALVHRNLELNSSNPDAAVPIETKKNIAGTGYYLFLESDNPSFTKFMVEFDYADGDGEWFLVDRSQHYNNKGRFFIELSDEIDSALQKVTINGSSTLKTNLKFRLCKSV